MIVLGIETSCDETAAAVVSGGSTVLASVVYSQVDAHRPHGGVVPEIASREHVARLPGVVAEAIRQSGVSWDRLEAVAVTYGPGLASSLLVGLAGAKALAIRLGIDCIGVHHLEAHLGSVFIGEDAPEPGDVLPARALVVSGGHTCLLRVTAEGDYRCVGRTVDDAAGEAFDKGAVLMDLGYPGGPAIEKAARGGDPHAIRFPRGLQRRTADSGHGDHRLDFSFSGVKTALRYYLRDQPPADSASERSRRLADQAASYQEAIVDVLVRKTLTGITDERAILLAGGVSLNRALRERISEAATARGLRAVMAAPAYCGDNAAMIAALAACGGGIRLSSAASIDAEPSLPFETGCLWPSPHPPAASHGACA